MQNATNGVGWEVQMYSRAFGWHAAGLPFTERDLAESQKKRLEELFPDREYRIYEALA